MDVLTDTDLQELAAIVGAENVSTRGPDLEAHAVDESCIPPHQPEVIVWPSTTEEVAAILRYANARRIPVSPWSGGSSLEGNPVPLEGGILLAMYRMNQVLEVREDDLQVVVQPGVIYDDLNKELRHLGMFFPPAPGSADVATIGGMVANNSSGMRAVKYGVTRDYVLKLTVVLPDGRILTLGGNAKKSTSGYDLVSLFVGSEGTLGVVTEITLRLLGLPEQVGVAVAGFDTLAQAADAIYECVRYGLDASALELLDAATVHATNVQQGLALRVAPTVFTEFHGSDTVVEEGLAFFREVCEDHGCADFQVATSPEERERLWSAREEAHESMKQSHPGCLMISGDVCVPISQFGKMIAFAHETSERFGLQIYAFGHAGDGNLHTEIIVRREDAEEMARGMRAGEAIVTYALELGGTIAGEHGVGYLKRQFLRQEHGNAVDVMRSIKALFDPNGIMNPGKILPPEE
jgi:D-lactate dehydrogenase (cytochrome)